MNLSKMTNVQLKSFEVFSEPAEFPLFLPDDKKPREFYAKIVYQAENKEGKWEIVFPKVELPIIQDHLPNFVEFSAIAPDVYCTAKCDFGFAELELAAGESDRCIIATLVDPAIRDMTLSEIEERLGYKVRIIGESNDG